MSLVPCPPPLSLTRWLAAAAACALALTAAPADAATLAIQGRLATAAGGPVADGGYPMAIGLYAAAQGGEALYLEKFLDVQVSGGVFAVPLGALDPKLKLPDALFTSSQAAFVGVQVGGDPELTRLPLHPVPYAVHASHAQVAADVQCSACVQTGALAVGAVTSDKIATGAVQASHVAFAYAGSDSKGGPATEALLAQAAKAADFATKAQSAEVAASAKAADTATTAEEAKVANLALKLQCTGCVSAAMLGPDVGSALEGQFVQKKGDAMAGSLEVGGLLTTAGGAHFQSKPLQGFRFENATKPPVECAPAQAGYAYFDPDAKALYICDGATFRPISIKAPIGSEADHPAPSCLAILNAGESKGDGTYWIDLDGGDKSNAKELLCDMAGGGWTRVLADDFEASAAGWSMTTISTCGSLGKILGGYNVLAGGTITRTLDLGGAAHTQVRVLLDYVSIDSSDGEQGFVTLDGSKVWTQTLNNCGQQVGTNWCGNAPPCHGDSKYGLDLKANHTAAKLTIGAGSTLDQAPSDESFGVDNVVVWIR